jgi:hypothetical protein
MKWAPLSEGFTESQFRETWGRGKCQGKLLKSTSQANASVVITESLQVLLDDLRLGLSRG